MFIDVAKLKEIAFIYKISSFQYSVRVILGQTGMLF